MTVCPRRKRVMVEGLSRPVKRKKRSESPKRLLDDGPIQDFSHQLEHPRDIGFTTSSSTLQTCKLETTHPSQLSKRNKRFATVESPPQDSEPTSKDKSLTCVECSLTTGSSQTSDQESISKDAGSEPFWSLHAKDLSQKLWLPIETDCAVLHSNWLSGSLSSMESSSWFSMKTWNPQNSRSLPKTFCPSSTFSIAGSTERGSTKQKKGPKPRKKPTANICRRVRLRPNPEVSNILRRWFGSVRYTYNWTLSCIKNKPSEYKINAYWLRKRFVNECNISKEKRWLLDTPKHVRDTAIIDLVQGFKTNFEKKKNNPQHRFEMKFRRKKDVQSLTIPSDAIKSWDTDNNTMSMFPSYIKNKIRFHTRKAPKDVTFDSKLVMDRLGRFYLCIPCHVSACENQTGLDSRKGWCSLDPGVRTFLTVYSPTVGTCYKIGDKDISRIFRLCKWLDKLCAGKHISCKKRRAQHRLRLRIKTLVDEVHWKAIRFLCTNFQNIIIPPFGVSQMIKRSSRKLRKKSVRQMVCWRHYTFRARLLGYAKRSNTQVHVMGEEYTSKACTHCMNVKHDLGGAKVYRCHCCQLVADRDVAGARNIFLKNASVL